LFHENNLSNQKRESFFDTHHSSSSDDDSCRRWLLISEVASLPWGTWRVFRDSNISSCRHYLLVTMPR
jgi:hypothetical protein